MSPSRPDVRSLRIASAAGGLTALVGVLVLTGWGTGSTVLLQVQKAWTPMVPMTAVAFCLSGAALLAITRAMARGWLTSDGWRRTGMVLGILVAVIGGRRLVLYCLGWTTGTDMLGLVPPEGPGQMALPTSLGFLLSGASLAMAADRRFNQAVQWLAGGVIFLGWSGITRYCYGGDTDGFFLSMAMHTALLFAVVGTGIFYARPDAGFMMVWNGDTTGSRLVRRLFPASLIVPVLVGWMVLQLERSSVVFPEAGLAAFAMANVLIFASLVWHTASRLHREDLLRREAERTTQEGRRFSDALIENLPGTFYLYDRDGKCLHWNKTLERVTGYDSAEIARMHALDFFPEGEKARVAERFAEVFARGRAEVDGGLRGKDGVVAPYFFTGIKVMVEGRECLAGLGIDITERKRAEVALQESERFVRAALNGLTAHIAILDERGVILTVNRAWLEFAEGNGMHAGQVGEGTNYLQVCERAHAAGSETAGAVAAAIREILEGRRRSYETEYPCHGPEEQRWFMVRITPFPADGPHRVVVAHENITRRKLQEEAQRESEERFRQVVESIHEVFWMRDVKEDRILYVSPGYEEIWGRDHVRLYDSGTVWPAGVHPEEASDLLETAREKQMAGTYDETFRIVRPDGTVRWISDRAFPIRDGKGEVYRIVGTAEDITERRKLEDQFRQAQKMEAIGTLAGGIAHDFNNILGAILGYTELTKMSMTGNKAATGYLDAVLQGARRAASLVRQILTFSRQQDQQRIPVKLDEVVGEPLKLLRATIPASIQLTESFAADLPSVLADPTQIHQIVMNLCTNAAHAMQDRPGRLELKLEKVRVDEAMAKGNTNLRPGPYVRMTVNDTGRGMEPDTLQRIFEPFFTTKGPGEGTGLGLAVVHGIMQSHDGAVAVYSEPGQGTVFHLYFPVYGADCIDAAAASAEVRKGNGERILLVDDEEPLAALGKAVLVSLGYVVTAGTRAQEMLARVEADPAGFDLVITDLAMPVMTGTEFAAKVRRIRPDLPVILTTGYTASLTPESVRAIGIRELLLKPLTRESLGRAVHNALRKTKPS